MIKEKWFFFTIDVCGVLTNLPLRGIIDNFFSNGRKDDMRAPDDVRFPIATDVNYPLCGENGADQVFGQSR